jgi:hypothetical protein
MVSATLAISALMVRLVWEVIRAPSAGYRFVVILVILMVLGISALLLYFTIKPGLKKLKSLPVKVSITLIVTIGFIDAIVHYIRFVPSPKAVLPISVVIASLLLMSAVIAYPLVLWIIWSKGKAKEG